MKKINFIVKISIILSISLTVSCDNKKETISLNIIPLAKTVGNYRILNLSEYASEVRYIPLEANDSVLIGEVRHISYENGKILIGDHISNCYLFDDNGVFRCKIGERGQGPNNYLYLKQIFIHEELIYQKDWTKMLIYDFDGSLVENINLSSNDIPVEYVIHKILPLKKDTFVMDVVAWYNVYYPKALLFELYQSGLKVIKEYPNHIKLDKEGDGYSSLEVAIMYRYRDGIRSLKRTNSDTLFTIDQNLEMKPAFIFDLGTYKPTQSYLEGRDYSVADNFITPFNIFESTNHLFINFAFGNHAPEPFEETPPIDSHRIKSINALVFSVFNKLTGELSLMKQPMKEKLGFKNDIDNGLVLWPHYISSNDELVTYVSVEEFMEYYEKIENPSPEMTKIATQITWDDNPIVVVTKLKE